MRSPEVHPEKSRRFVILAHQRPDGDVHYDLLVESAGAGGREQEGPCLTWSFSRPPARRQQRCRRIFDHPHRFLTYEGPLGNSPGRVRQYDVGTCCLDGDPDRSLVLTLSGGTITGAFRLRRISEGEQADDTTGRPYEGEYGWQPIN